MPKETGFTIIELIVVIAIIVILAAIVLAGVVGYMNASKNAAIRGNMAGIIALGTTWYESGTPTHPEYSGSYVYFCRALTTGQNLPLKNVYNAIVNAGGTNYRCCCNGGTMCAAPSDNSAVCPNGASTSWCVCVTEMDGTTTFCVDSSGTKKEMAGPTLCSARCLPSAGHGLCDQ